MPTHAIKYELVTPYMDPDGHEVLAPGTQFDSMDDLPEPALAQFVKPVIVEVPDKPDKPAPKVGRPTKAEAEAKAAAAEVKADKAEARAEARAEAKADKAEEAKAEPPKSAHGGFSGRAGLRP